MREGYAVQVLKWGEPILTIGHEHLSGQPEFSDEDAEAIRNGSRHLWSFIGDGKPSECFACGGLVECEPNCPLSELEDPTREHN